MEREEERRRLIGNPFSMSKWRYWLHPKIFGVRGIVSLLFWGENPVTARHLAEKMHESWRHDASRLRQRLLPDDAACTQTSIARSRPRQTQNKTRGADAVKKAFLS